MKERGFGENPARRHTAGSFCEFGCTLRGKRKRLSSRACVLVSTLHYLAVCPWSGDFTSLGLSFLTGQTRTVETVTAKIATAFSHVGSQCTPALLNFLKRF